MTSDKVKPSLPELVEPLGIAGELLGDVHRLPLTVKVLLEGLEGRVLAEGSLAVHDAGRSNVGCLCRSMPALSLACCSV